MSRHKNRMDCLAQRLDGSSEDLFTAFWSRRTDEEIEAELVRRAVEAGLDAQTAAADLRAALAWTERQGRCHAGGEAGGVYLAAHGDSRERPLLWPDRERDARQDPDLRL